jgi:protein-disulfide isomerase
MDKFGSCFEDPKMKEEISADMADGRRIGVSATPTFIINGRMISGANPETIRKLIKRELGTS